MTWSEVVGARRAEVSHPVASRLIESILTKQSAVMLSGDVSSTNELIKLIEKVHPWIAAIKTHIDCMEGGSDGWEDVIACCREKDLPIMEDRKFADIGAISYQQMLKGVNIAGWADVVTAHGVSGPDIIDGIIDAWKGEGRQGGVVLLAQMSSRGNLVEAMLTEPVVEMGEGNPGVIGYIGNGSNPEAIKRLRMIAPASQLILTPGIHPDAGGGERGQRYGTPERAIEAGSDMVIIGSAIYRAANPADVAKRCAAATLDGFVRRATK